MVKLETADIEKAHNWAKEVEAKGLNYRNSLLGKLAELAVKADLLKHFPDWPIEVPYRFGSDRGWDVAAGGRVFVEVKISDMKCEVTRLTRSSRSPVHFYVEAWPLAGEFEKLKGNRIGLEKWLLKQTEVSIESIGWADKNGWDSGHGSAKESGPEQPCEGFDDFWPTIEKAYQHITGCQPHVECVA